MSDFPIWYPPAVRKPIPAGISDPVMRPVMVVLHVDAGNSSSLFNWFDGPSGGIESHLFVKKDGSVEQYRRFDREADAQFQGNSWAAPSGRLGGISVETQGRGPGWWTKAQKAAIKEFLSWAHVELGIPLQQVKAARPLGLARGGVGWHTQFPSWSNVPGKTCPGPRRIAWFKAHLVPWMAVQGRQFVTAKDSDTWTSLAAAHNTTVPHLLGLNHLAPKVGSRIRVL